MAIYDPDYSVESILIKADAKALSVLSPRLRSMIIIIRALGSGEKGVDEIRAECTLLGFTCRGLERAIDKLYYHGLVEKKDDKVRLTEHGRELLEALQVILFQLRDFTYKLLKNEASIDDLYTQLVTPLASIVGVVESFIEEAESLQLALAIHAYVSLLVASLLALLARKKPDLVLALRSLTT
ncbi:MAG: hypothetical protein ABWW69_06610 [Pyrodictiaceae archaeon]